MGFPEGARFRPKYAAAGGGGGGGGTGGAPNPLTQGVEQIAQGKVDQHVHDQPHLSDPDVRRIANQEHGASTHPGLAQQTAVDDLGRRVTQTEQAVTQLQQQAAAPTPARITSQDVANAVQQDPQPFVVALRPHLPTGTGTGPSETQVRQWADEQIAASGAIDDADAATIAQTQIQDKLNDGTLAAGASLTGVQGQVTALDGRITTVEGRLPAGTDPVVTVPEQRQAIAQLLNIPPADLDEAHVRGRIEELAQGTGLSATQLDQIAANVATRLQLSATTNDALNARIEEVASRVFDRRSMFRWIRRRPAAPAAPVAVVPPADDVIARRALLVGLGVGAAALGIGGMWWLIAHSTGTPTYVPPGGTSGGETYPSTGINVQHNVTETTLTAVPSFTIPANTAALIQGVNVVDPTTRHAVTDGSGMYEVVFPTTIQGLQIQNGSWGVYNAGDNSSGIGGKLNNALNIAVTNGWAHGHVYAPGEIRQYISPDLLGRSDIDWHFG